MLHNMLHKLCCLLFIAGAAFAQTGRRDRPRMTWTGYVTGSAVLYIQGDRVDVQGRTTGAVDRPDARFNSSLPAAPVRVRMQVRRGRGRVELVEQPEPQNEYSAVVQITPPGQRAEQYRLDFYWESQVRELPK